MPIHATSTHFITPSTSPHTSPLSPHPPLPTHPAHPYPHTHPPTPPPAPTPTRTSTLANTTLTSAFTSLDAAQGAATLLQFDFLVAALAGDAAAGHVYDNTQGAEARPGTGAGAGALTGLLATYHGEIVLPVALGWPHSLATIAGRVHPKVEYGCVGRGGEACEGVLGVREGVCGGVCEGMLWVGVGGAFGGRG